MIYPIVIYGSQILRNESESITPDYPELQKLIEDMWITLGEAEGVGLAAPQIGKNIRLFIVDCSPWGEEDPALAEFRKVFTDHLAPLRKNLIKNKLQKMARGSYRAAYKTKR